MIEKKAGNFETLRIFSSLHIPGQGIPHPPAADGIPLIGLFDHECDLNDGNDDGFGTALVPDDEPSGAVARSSIEGEPESGSPAGIFSPDDERNESVSPSAPELEEYPSYRMMRNCLILKISQHRNHGSFDGYARILSRLTVFSASRENFFLLKEYYGICLHPRYPPGTAWH